MKRIVLFILVMCHFVFSYSQIERVINYLTNEEYTCSVKDLDDAFAAPLSKFVGKKWYQGFDDTFVQYVIFNNNQTGAIVEDFSTKNKYTYPVRVIAKTTFRWKRNGNDLTMTFTPYLDTVTPVESSMTKLSPRVRAEVKKDCVKSQENLRAEKIKEANYRINKITNDVFYYGREYYVSQKRYDEIIEKVVRAKAEREAIRIQQEEIRAKEAQKKEIESRAKEMFYQACAYERQGKFDDAIVAIDKAIELQPNKVDWYDSKGEILYFKGDKEAAKAMWEKAISLDPLITDPKWGSVLNWLINKKGWNYINKDFPKEIPFKKIRVKKPPIKEYHGHDNCVYFTTSPNSNPNKKRTPYRIDYSVSCIYYNEKFDDVKFKKCTDVGNGWFEYEYSQNMYFSHIEENVSQNLLQVLIE